MVDCKPVVVKSFRKPTSGALPPAFTGFLPCSHSRLRSTGTALIAIVAFRQIQHQGDDSSRHAQWAEEHDADNNEFLKADGSEEGNHDRILAVSMTVCQ